MDETTERECNQMIEDKLTRWILDSDEKESEKRDSTETLLSEIHSYLKISSSIKELMESERTLDRCIGRLWNCFDELERHIDTELNENDDGFTEMDGILKTSIKQISARLAKGQKTVDSFVLIAAALLVTAAATAETEAQQKKLIQSYGRLKHLLS